MHRTVWATDAPLTTLPLHLNGGGRSPCSGQAGQAKVPYLFPVARPLLTSFEGCFQYCNRRRTRSTP